MIVFVVTGCGKTECNAKNDAALNVIVEVKKKHLEGKIPNDKTKKRFAAYCQWLV